MRFLVLIQSMRINLADYPADAFDADQCLPLEQVMTDGVLKLTEVQNQPNDILPFERRQAPRRPVSGQVTTLWQDTGSLRKIASLDLQDISNSGLCALSGEPVEVNSRITVFFQPHGPEGGYDAAGRVVRCQAMAEGYEIGIRFDSQAAAA